MTDVDAVFRVENGSGEVQGRQVIDLVGGVENYTLSVQNTTAARVVFNGSTDDPRRSWRIDSFAVFAENVSVSGDREPVPQVDREHVIVVVNGSVDAAFATSLGVDVVPLSDALWLNSDVTSGKTVFELGSNRTDYRTVARDGLRRRLDGAARRGAGRDRTRDARPRRGEPANPARVVVDSRARTATDAGVVDDRAHTFLLVADVAPTDRLETFRAKPGVTVIRAGEERVDLRAALEALGEEGVDRLLVEGGGEVIYSLFAADLVDELSVFVGSTVIGGRDAPTLADGDGFVETFPELSLSSVEQLDDGALLTWTVENS